MRFLIFILVFMPVLSFAGLYKPYIDVGKFVEQIESRGEGVFDIVRIDKLNEKYVQVFFRDDKLDLKYSNFKIGYTDYALYELNGMRNYEYTESFIDCLNKNKFSHRHIYDGNGVYIGSKIFILGFEDEVNKVSEKFCEKYN